MVADLSIYAMISMYALMLIPVAIFFYLQLGLVRETLIAITRMTAQLLLVGLYLKYLFQLNHLLLSLLWVVVMLVIATFSILNKAGLKRRPFFWRSFVGVAGSTLFVSGWFILISIQPEPIYDARYMIPIIGMVLGNCLRSNVLCLERFYSSIRKNENEFTTYLLLGATLHEAVRPYLREAIKAAVNPSSHHGDPRDRLSAGHDDGSDPRWSYADPGHSIPNWHHDLHLHRHGHCGPRQSSPQPLGRLRQPPESPIRNFSGQ